MDANVGLHDSFTAVEWTKEYISKFGGDPDRITVIGQSAGAAIINMMLTAKGGRGKLPFSQVRLYKGMVPERDRSIAKLFVGDRNFLIFDASKGCGFEKGESL
jgi:acetyl esterase/lipase